VSLVTLVGGVRWYGAPVAGMLVDANATVSTSVLRREAHAIGMAFPDRMESIEGRPLGSRSPGRAWDDAVAAAQRRGQREIAAVAVDLSGRRREVRLHLSTLEPLTWWAFTSVWLAGLLWGGVAIFALRVAGHTPLGRCTGKVGMISALFMLTLGDVHGPRQLVPIFYLAFGAFGPAYVAFALRVPDDAAALRRFPGLERATEVIGLLLGALMLAVPWAGRLTALPQLITSVALVLGVGFFLVVFLVRAVAARGARGRTARAIAFALLPPLAVVGAAVGVPLAGASGVGPSLVKELGPSLAAALIPVTVAYTFWRYDLHGGQRLLSRAAARAALGAAACLLAAGAGTALAVLLGVPVSIAAIVSLSAAAVAMGVLYLAFAMSDRFWFRSRRA
jgi:hypothetical protein